MPFKSSPKNGDLGMPWALGVQWEKAHKPEGGRTNKILRLKGSSSLIWSPIIKTNPQSFWVPARLGHVLRRDGNIFCT